MKTTVLLIVFSLVLAFAEEAPELQEFTSGSKLFTTSVYNELLVDNTDNILVSPFSAEIVLALTQSGAKDATAEEMRTSLHLPDTKEKTELAVKSLLPTLRNSEYVLQTANKIYVEENFAIKEDFKEVAADIYQASFQNLDFAENVAAAEEINKWVAEETGDKIQNLIKSDDLDATTRVVLVNALYFQGNWSVPFQTTFTKKADFYTASETVEIETMFHQSVAFNYAESVELDAQILELPFNGDEASMVVVLPNKKEGIAVLEKQMDAVLEVPKFEKEFVQVVLPKFKIESTIDFMEVLEKLGMRKAFDPLEADFSGIAGEKGDIVITKVAQKTFIDVNEVGVEAAAATVVDGSYSMDPIPTKYFVADHPFVFYIKVRDVVLFEGRVLVPEYHFEKRGGTTDLGKDYEDSVVAHLALKYLLDKNVKRFSISANKRDFKAFDDVVLQLSTPQQELKYALQLKHVTQSNRGSLRNKLVGPKGNFSIQKYFEEYQRLEDTIASSYNFVLFTNHQFDVADEGNETKFPDGFDIRISKTRPSSIIFGKEANCFKFELINVKPSVDSKLVQKYEQFFQRFFLYANQSCVAKVEEDILNIFRNSFGCESDDFGRKYIHFINKWSEREGRKNTLHKDFLQRVVTLQLISPFLITFPLSSLQTNKKAKLLTKLINRCNVIFVSEYCCDKLIKIWEKDNSFMDLKEINKMAIEYQIISKPVQAVSELDDLKRNKISWLMKTHPLIVYGNVVTFRAINLCQNMNFIVCSNHFQTNIIENPSTFRNLLDLPEQSSLYQNILNEFRLTFQGNTDVSLKRLISCNKKIRKLITLDELILMVEDSLEVGVNEETLPKEYYIERTLTKNIVSYKFIEDATENTLIIISHSKNIVEKRLKNTKAKVLRFKKELSWKHFSQICQKLEAETACHNFVARKHGILEWAHSSGKIDTLKQFRKPSQLATPEADLLNINSNNDVEIICGEPGIGKTILIKNLRNRCSDGFLKILIYPKEHFAFFRNAVPDGFMEYILKKNSKNSFELNLFRIMAGAGLAIFFWDGLDEIPDNILPNVTETIKKMSGRGYKQFVTTRSHLVETLERTFNVLSITINRLEIVEQNIYIQNRLKCPKHLKEALLTKITNYMKTVRYNDILGIPLQLAMLMELINENPERYSDLSKIFSVVDLYRYTIDEKLNLYFRKLNQALNEITDDLKDYLLGDYQKVALRLLLDENHAEELRIDCNQFLEKIRRNKCVHGIITSVTHDGIATFLHLSYAEYLVALYFYENYGQLSRFEDVLFSKRFRNVRFMFDLLMANQSSIHLAVLYKNLEDFSAALHNRENQLSDCVDKGGRNPLQILCSWGEEYPLLESEPCGDFFVVNERLSGLVKEESQAYVEMFMRLIKECDPKQKDQLYDFDSFFYADKAHCLYPLAALAHTHNIHFGDLRYFCDIYSVFYYSILFDYKSFLKTFQKMPFVKLKHSLNETVLNTAVVYNRVEFVEKLLSVEEYRATIDNKDTLEETLLFKASEKGFDEVGKLLLQHKADINATNLFGWTPIIAACENGHVAMARLLLEYNANVNVAEEIGYAPLFVACINGNKDLVKLLIEYKADVNITTTESCTPLLVAVEEKHEEIVNLLLACNSNVNIADENGWTPLLKASQGGDMEIVKQLIEHGAEVNLADKENCTPVNIAAENNQREVVKLLLKHNVDVNISDCFGVSPLFIACQKGYAKVVKLLLQHGTEINASDKENWTPLHVATENNHLSTVKLLLQHAADVDIADNEGNTPLHVACGEGHEEIARMLIEYNANVNIANYEGSTPLSQACEMEHKKIVNLLLEQSADVNIVNQYVSPIQIASWNGNLDIVRLLIEYGALIDNFYFDDGTVLFIASHKGHLEVVQLLLEHDAYVNFQKKKGCTPIYTASKEGNMEVLKLLLKYGADVNIVNNKGCSPLHVASKNGHVEIAKLLIENSIVKSGENQSLWHANLDFKNDKGCTALHVASENGQLEVVKLLLAHQADVNSCNNSGWTPIHAACYNGQVDVVKLLLEHGADINSDTNCTPIAIASRDSSRENYLKIVKLLVQKYESNDNINDE